MLSLFKKTRGKRGYGAPALHLILPFMPYGTSGWVWHLAGVCTPGCRSFNGPVPLLLLIRSLHPTNTPTNVKRFSPRQLDLDTYLHFGEQRRRF